MTFRRIWRTDFGRRFSMKATQAAVIGSMLQARENLIKAGLLYLANDTVVERLGRGRRRLTWATSATRPDLHAASYSDISEYLSFLDGNHFQFQLIDGSLIQVSYVLDSNNNIVESRLAWYPCPIDFLPEELEYAPLSEMILTAPTEAIRCRSPFRFDYSPDQAAPNHSCSHLHLGGEDIRLPVQRAFEPSRFIRFIIRTFYPNIWNEFHLFKLVDDWGAEDRLDNDDRLFGFLSWHIPVAQIGEQAN